MLTLLKSLIILLLEYCCQLWNPWKAKDIQAIEAIQQTFTYKITEVQHLNYWETLHEHKLYSLQRGRERYIIIYISKITQHMVLNIDETMGQKIKTRKHPRHRTQCVLVSNKQKPSTIPSRKYNNCIGASFAEFVAKISESSKVLKLKNSNLSLTNFWSSFLMSQNRPTMSPHQEAIASSTSSLMEQS